MTGACAGGGGGGGGFFSIVGLDICQEREREDKGKD